MTDKIPSPQGEVIRLSDKDIAQYVELPADTHFVESIAHNPNYAKGVGYMAAQRNVNGNSLETYVYEIRPGVAEAKRLFGPIATSRGTDVTVFGSALSSTGILYLCVYNQNIVIDFDLQASPGGGTVRPRNEIGPIPSPNDVCIDPKDETRLYVAGGKFRKSRCVCLQWTNSARGQLFEARVKADGTSFTTKIVAKNLKTLAGVGVVAGKVWLAQLFNMIALPQGGNESTAQTVWRGNDGQGEVWLADNIDHFEGGLALVPAYSTVSELVVQGMLTRTGMSSLSMLCMQAASAQLEQENLLDALWDPEVDVIFCNTFIKDGVPPAPVRLVLLPASGGAALHFEVDLEETRRQHPPREVEGVAGRKGRRHFFNEQVTHAAHLHAADGSPGWVACVNFEQPRVLLLRDAPFRAAVAANPAFR